jgi:ribosome-associated protein
VNVIEEKKGEDIILLDIREIAPFADFFVICSGTSNRMLDALADAAVEQVKKNFDLRARIEGNPNDGWVLADFGDVILHLFSPDRREYYRLEELWSKGKILLRLQ